MQILVYPKLAEPGCVLTNPPGGSHLSMRTSWSTRTASEPPFHCPLWWLAELRMWVFWRLGSPFAAHWDLLGALKKSLLLGLHLQRFKFSRSWVWPGCGDCFLSSPGDTIFQLRLWAPKQENKGVTEWRKRNWWSWMPPAGRRLYLSSPSNLRCWWKEVLTRDCFEWVGCTYLTSDWCLCKKYSFKKNAHLSP